MTQLDRSFKLLDKIMMKAAPGLVETCLSNTMIVTNKDESQSMG
jgi:hypothetical protein